ncbi:MAG: hypothetical protein MI922_29065 [Bacteroidales bacterium]|nr:hypothetical protein [Bacteroidales bacterium]
MEKIAGIMGPGEGARHEDMLMAEEVGAYFAKSGFVVLTGGRNCGVMHSALKGAKKAGGVTIGILPGDNYKNISKYVDIPIITDMGNARNQVNVLSLQIVCAIGMGAGTLSEIALSLKTKKNLILMNQSKEVKKLFEILTLQSR